MLNQPPMRYRWTHWPTGKTGVSEKSFDKCLSEGGHHLIGQLHFYQPNRLYSVLIEHWNGLGGGHWKYELLPEPVVPEPVRPFVLDWVI
jgi:hypothetical protein